MFERGQSGPAYVLLTRPHSNPTTADSSLVDKLNRLGIERERSLLSPQSLVLLMETLSNFSAVQRRQRSATKRDRDDEDVPIVTHLRHPNRKLNPTEGVDLVEAYQAGEHISSLARRFSMHEQTVKAHLRRAGIRLRPWPRLVAAEIAEAALLYVAGWTLYQLGDTFGCNASTMRRALHLAGVDIRPRGRSSNRRASISDFGESDPGSGD
jgi:transposase-like protein